MKIKTKAKTKMKPKTTKTKMRTKTKTKTKMKTTKMKNKMKTKMKTKMNFCFCFHFVFHFCFCFCFLKVFAFLITPLSLEGQLSFDLPRSAIAFSFVYYARGLVVQQMVRIHCCCSLFSFSTGSTLFAQICSKMLKLLKLKFESQSNSNMQNSLMLFTFFVFDRKCPFWANLVQKIKIVSLR